MKLLGYVALGCACYFVYSRGYVGTLVAKLKGLKDKLLPR